MKRIFFAIIFLAAAIPAMARPTIKGRVTSAGEPVKGVLVSDGVNIVATDARGRYAIKSDKADSVVFITTPSGYAAKSTDGIRPGFWALLTAPAGKVEVHDFELVPQDQSAYSALFVTDLHFARVSGGTDTLYYKSHVLPKLRSLAEERIAAGKPVYIFNLGDFSHDSMWWENNFNGQDAFDFIARQGLPAPMMTVSGNHDNDASVVGPDSDFKGAWRFRHVWGPDRCSMDIGGDHWVLLDDIVYNNAPVEQVKYKNILGGRDYECRLKDEQMDWLRKDLQHVPDGARIYFCVHCPFINVHSPKESIPQEQVEEIMRMTSRFAHVTVYAGHAHMMHMPASAAYPNLEQFVLPATSGNMWFNEMRGFQSLSGDGTDAGIFYVDYESSAAPVWDYDTFLYGSKLMRVYDMNGVAEYYRTEPDVRMQLQLFKDARHDYSSEKYQNQVFVNYWGHCPGQSVHMFEDGVELPVKMVKTEDPLYNVTHFVAETKLAGKYKSSLKSFRMPHMFVATARTATSPVTIQVRDASGAVLHEEVLVRPKAFSLDID